MVFFGETIHGFFDCSLNGQKKGHDMEPSKEEIIKAIGIIRTGMTTNDIDADDFNWAIHILQRAFRNGYSVVKTS